MSFRPIGESDPLETPDTSPVYNSIDVKPESPSPHEEMEDIAQEILNKIGTEYEKEVIIGDTGETYSVLKMGKNQWIALPKEGEGETLGKGSFGSITLRSVFVISKIGDRVIVKTREMAVKTGDNLELTHTEMRAERLKGFSTPHVSKEVYIMTQDGNLHLVQHNLGKPFRSFLADKDVTVENKLELLEDAWKGIEEEMEAGLYHLDHNPNNILCYHGQARIVDIGGDIAFFKESDDMTWRDFLLQLDSYHDIYENKMTPQCTPFYCGAATRKQLQDKLNDFLTKPSEEKYNLIKEDMKAMMEESHVLMQAMAILEIDPDTIEFGKEEEISVIPGVVHHNTGWETGIKSVDVDVLRAALLEKYQGPEIDSICSTLQNLS